MGVPKFFRYTSERYPCLNELVKQYQIPEFDNMYLDMNGIIHNCSHPDDSNPHFRITEEKIFQDVFHYISILFQIIKPKKLFFMAIDGVAPRAKMNQQRGRRFRSAREAEELEEKARAKGETLPSEKRFDSNCITPGTVFMARLHEQLRYFVKQKMTSDPQWAKVKVILSGHETPGEGEHKIMDYIRWSRSQPDYEPNTRHCLYGLDADLIMLGMCTHEPHFALLREEVKFGKSTQRATSPEETNFYLLHLSLLREYLEQEFISIKHKLPFEYDIEKIVDDWVLMGFLVGNDFIPNLPNMHISNDALPVLYQTYMAVLPTLDGYINEAGDLNLIRFETFMQELSKIDKQAFQDTYADLRYFEGKTGRRPNANERREYKPNNDDTFNVNIDDIKANKPDDELQALINATHDMFMDDVNEDDDDSEYEDIDSSDDEANFNMEFSLHKKDYYMNKLDYSKVTEEVLASQAECYVRAIQWNLHYYYRGCPSWCWYYPHHYAPYISDIKGFADLDIRFEKGEPFKPFEQLLAVLPAASKHLLPTPFHDLMTDEDSPIVHYYPINFETDLNGKKNDWEAVVLIPFIDEVNLLSAMEPCYQRLTDEERKRNTHGPMLVYQWTDDSEGPVKAPAYFPAIPECHSKEILIWREELEVSESQLKRGMLPNANRELVYPGFPTMRHLKYKTSIKKKRVKVFDQPSRNDNMIVEIIRDDNDVDPKIDDIATSMLGQIIWVGWPHLTKAKVLAVSNEEVRLKHVDEPQTQGYRNGHLNYSTERNTGNLHKQWISERATVIEHNMNRLGIEVGDVRTLIHAASLKGYKYTMNPDSTMSLVPSWCPIPVGYAYQAVVKHVHTIEPTEAQTLTAGEAYRNGDKVFLLTTGQYYGSQATVLDAESIRSGRIKVSVYESAEPVPSVVSHVPSYRSSNHAAAACGVSSQLLSRVTGSILVVLGNSNNEPTEQKPKINVGLNLKFNKKNQEVTGYTRRCATTGTWLYSDRCIELVSNYAKKYPELFDYLTRSFNKDIFFESDLWPGEVGKDKPKEVQAWLKIQPHVSAEKRECGSEALEIEEIAVLAKNIDAQLADLTSEKKVTLHVKWNLLYKPDLHQGNMLPDPKGDFKMFDRIVCVAKNITVPYGAKGTITGLFAAGLTNTVRLSDKVNADTTYQVLFDQPLTHDSTQDNVQDRVYRMLPTNMLSISYGRKLRDAVNTKSSTDYKLNQSPNILKRDKQPSAFALYSPTKENCSPISKPDPIQPPTQDPGTELLKNLLKISQNDSDTTKSNKKMGSSDMGLNWRVKSENTSTRQSATPQRVQNSWRADNRDITFNQDKQQPQPTGEWTNRTQKPPTSAPIFPVFPPNTPIFQPRHSAPPANMFPPGGHPYMQHNQPPQWNAQNNMKPENQQLQYNQQQSNQHQTQNLRQLIQRQNMPSMPHNLPSMHNMPSMSQNMPSMAQNMPHMPQNMPHMQQTVPNVLQNMQPMPQSLPQASQSLQQALKTVPQVSRNQHQQNYQQNQCLSALIKPNSAAEKLSNPFVPLQVQVRRAPNQPASSSSQQSKETSKPPSKPDGVQQPDDVNSQPPVQQPQTSTQKQRRKKGRIAANLPFIE